MSVTFPDVPNYPGVPQLARAFLPSPSSVAVSIGGAALSSLFGSLVQSVQWAIYDSAGDAVIVPDSFLDFEHHPHWDIPDFPVQGTGSNPTAFATYNKVKLPFDIHMRMSKSTGGVAGRYQFLKALDAAADSIALYTIVTPEMTYSNADILDYDIVRTTEGMSASGAYFLTEVDVTFRQIIPVSAQYSTTTLQNASNASARPQSVTGPVIPLDLTGSIQSEVSSASFAGAFGSL